MTNSEITETIEKEFGWLSPDEKQKLNSMMVRTWNEAIVASVDVAKNVNYPSCDPAYEIMIELPELKLKL